MDENSRRMFWDERWETGHTPWDTQAVTPALAQKLRCGKGRCLVPGCGRGHDAAYLAEIGFQVTAVDISPGALQAARDRYPEARVDWVQGDMLAMAFPAEFDLVWEYTCFCALLPEDRPTYLDQVWQTLRPGGRYMGLVFQSVRDPEDGPPFQVDPAAFKVALGSRFNLVDYEPETPLSIKPRSGREIWFEAVKPR